MPNLLGRPDRSLVGPHYANFQFRTLCCPPNRATLRTSPPLLPPALGHCAPDSAKILAQSRSGQTGPHCVRRFIGAPFRCNSFFSAFLGPKQLAGGRKAARSWAPNQRLLLLLLLLLFLLLYCCTRVTVAAATAAAEPANCNSCKLQVATVLAFVLAKVHQNRVSHRAINHLANQSIKPSIK